MNTHDPVRDNRVDWVELVVEVLAKPIAAFRKLRHAQLLLPALGLFLLAQVPAAMSDPLLEPEGLVPAEATLGGLLLRLIISLPTLVVIAGATQLFARFMGGEAAYTTLLQAMALASLPGLLLAPFVAAAYLMPAAANMLAIAGLGVMVWSFVLTVIAVREVHEFSTLRAVAVILLPAAILALVFTVAIIGLATLVAG